MPTTGRVKCMAAIAYGKLKLSVQAKERLVESLCPGKTSFRALTNDEADRVIDELKRQAGQAPTRPLERDRRRVRPLTETGAVTMLVTPAQRERLAQLTRDCLEAGVSSTYVAGVAHRACGRPTPQTSQEAAKAIEALKAVLTRAGAGDLPKELA